MSEKELIANTPSTAKTDPKVEREFSIEEFSITELEERLELVGRCNGSCKGQEN